MNAVSVLPSAHTERVFAGDQRQEEEFYKLNVYLCARECECVCLFVCSFFDLVTLRFLAVLFLIRNDHGETNDFTGVQFVSRWLCLAWQNDVAVRLSSCGPRFPEVALQPLSSQLPVTGITHGFSFPAIHVTTLTLRYRMSKLTAGEK